MAPEAPHDEVMANPTSGQGRGPAPRRRPRRGLHARPRSRGRRIAWWSLGAVVIVVALALVVSLVGALRTPGNARFEAKWADWMRDHHGAFLVQRFENVYYSSKQPKKGGTVTALHALPTVQTVAPTTVHPASTLEATTTTTLPPHLAAPPPVPLVVRPPVDGEGQWMPVDPQVAGLPTMRVAQFRADDIYTSQLASAVWMDTKLLRARFVAGAQEPAGVDGPHSIDAAARPSVVAAFNGGFRFKDAHGGAYVDGRQVVPLVDGAASFVIHTDGSVEIGAWNRDVAMSGNVESVLQNLTLLVDGGQLDPRLSHNDTSMWGYTLKGSIAVARSGVGITADGALVYVAGPSLTAKSLAESLQRAGAVRAMTLDINPEWVTFLFYGHPNPQDPSQVTGTKLYPEITRPTDRYLSPDDRDFFTLSLR